MRLFRMVALIAFTTGGVVLAGELKARPKTVPDASETQTTSGLSLHRYTRFGVQVKNVTDRVVPRADLWVATPIPGAAGHRLTRFEASYPFEWREDRLGNKLAHFAFSNIPPYAVKIVHMDCVWQTGTSSVPAERISSLYLESDALADYKSSEFALAAPPIAPGPVSNAVAQVYEWVRRNMEPGSYDPQDRGALYALMTRKGDCTEYAALFVALCRAAGIPARIMGGYRLYRDALLDPAGYHNWAEVVVDGRWVLVDPSEGVFDKDYEYYYPFRVLGESDTPLRRSNRFAVEGEGVVVEFVK